SDPFSPSPRVEVITSVQRRRRWTTAEKVRLVEEAMQPGMSVSYVARRAGIAPSQLFAWKRRMLEGGATAVQADDDVVGAGRVRELENACAIWSACWARRPWRSRSSRRRSILPPPKSQRCGSPRSIRTVRCEDGRRHARRFPLQPRRAGEETPSRKPGDAQAIDRKSTRLNSSHVKNSY